MVGLIYIFIGVLLIILLCNIPMSWISQREEVYDDIEGIKKASKNKNNKNEYESRY